MKKLHLLALIATLALAGAARAQTENVDFSISNLQLLAGSYSPYSTQNQNVSGSLTGELFGLTLGSTDTTPTSIVVTSLPGQTAFTTPLTFTPVTTSDDSTPASSGGFNVSSAGVVSSSSKYSATYQSANYDLQVQFNYEGLFDGYNLVFNAAGGYSASPDTAVNTVENFNDGGGVTYTVAAAPEPTSWALGVTAVALFLVLRRRALGGA